MILLQTLFDVLNCLLWYIKLWVWVVFCTAQHNYILFLSVQVSTCNGIHCKEADVFGAVCSNCLLCVLFRCGHYYPGRNIHLVLFCFFVLSTSLPLQGLYRASAAGTTYYFPVWTVIYTIPAQFFDVIRRFSHWDFIRKRRCKLWYVFKLEFYDG